MAEFALYDQPDPPELSLSVFGTSRLVIRAESQCFVLDPRTGAGIDTFWVFASSISPDGRYLALQRSVPLHGDYLRDAVYALYDLQQPRTSNRAIKSNEGDAGFIVYPDENRKSRSYRLKPDASHAHERMSPLVWLSPTLLSVVDRVDDRVSVVLIDIGDGASNPHVKTIPLDPVSVLNAQGLSDLDHVPAEFLRVMSISEVSRASGIWLRIVFDSGGLAPPVFLRKDLEIQFAK